MLSVGLCLWTNLIVCQANQRVSRKTDSVVGESEPSLARFKSFDFGDIQRVVHDGSSGRSDAGPQLVRRESWSSGELRRKLDRFKHGSQQQELPRPLEGAGNGAERAENEWVHESGSSAATGKPGDVSSGEGSKQPEGNHATSSPTRGLGDLEELLDSGARSSG